MTIIQVVALGLLAAVFILILRESKPELAIFLSIAVGVIIFLSMMNYISSVLYILEELTIRADINLLYLNTLLKIIGIAYIAEFGAQVCRDAGEGTTASKIEFAGKIIILFLAIPLVVVVLETIISLIP
ncbi:stage III sporulation protein AD [Candidatus Contubernalis alkaliaceticus]|uniref:stage III sporulation protein AD n=1 Tax=Candidatus Contubernalis alkaliaceticus TaxID=338645 RepID=UPI001F4C2F36|nr:stage III sporulation protein AD [Candidatus Contubernalis alkalaceticus]UNC92554.1 stage III sporulation protein AD [Candidatus Contubernalis alkalaceticus]